MIIIRTPYRISFFGGSTDYPAWYRQHGGAVISTTINKYSFLVLRKLPPIFDYKYRIRYYDRQETNTIEDIQVPVIREAIRHMGFTDGLDITHHGDLPNRTGVGSSSSFTVGLLHGLSVLQNRQVTKRDLALQAINLEQNILSESVGSQDQVAAAFGGFNKITFGGASEFLCSPMHVSKDALEQLESWVQVFFTEQLRNASDIAEKKIENIKTKQVDLNIVKQITEEAEKILFSSSTDRIKELARLMDEQWQHKKTIEKSITNSEIDEIYKKGINAGAIGGKLLGAGGGGFMLFLTPPYKQESVAKALGLKEVPIDFEYLGSQLIYHDYQDQEV
jgi:D-glycero-alpha-D-manno-heptose-7-phosphate kinase